MTSSSSSTPAPDTRNAHAEDYSRTDDTPQGDSQLPVVTTRIEMQWAGQRLDKALCALFPEHTRARLQDWLQSDRISIDGKTGLKASYKLKGGEQVILRPKPPEHMQALVPEEIDFAIVHEDDQCLVINKPAGLVVHPAAGHWSGTLMNGLLFRYPELVDVPRAGIVHRLDKDTTGLMVVARQPDTQQSLIREMAKRRIRRIYLALIWGRMTQRRTVEAAIGRDPRNRQKMAVVGHGKPAITHFHPLALGQLADLPVTLLACKLETGRTHQIRVHALHAGFGLVGDPVYRQRGARAVPFERQALHACYLAFCPDGLVQAWDTRTIAELPEDFAGLLNQAGITVPDAQALLDLPALWPEETGMDASQDDDDLDDEDFDDDGVEVIYVRDED